MPLEEKLFAIGMAIDLLNSLSSANRYGVTSIALVASRSRIFEPAQSGLHALTRLRSIGRAGVVAVIDSPGSTSSSATHNVMAA